MLNHHVAQSKDNSWKKILFLHILLVLHNEWITATSNSRETLALTANMDVIFIDVINIVYQIIVHLIK